MIDISKPNHETRLVFLHDAYFNEIAINLGCFFDLSEYPNREKML